MHSTTSELPLLGAAVTVDRLAENLEWFLSENRDIEIQNWSKPNALDTESTQIIRQLDNLLDGFEGRMGIHAPYLGLNIACKERCVQDLCRKRFRLALDIAQKIGATHMVIHSPFLYLGDAFLPHTHVKKLEEEIDMAHETLDPIVEMAEQAECGIVIENIVDKNTHALFALVDSFDSDIVNLSVDTGHAHIQHVLHNSPTVDTWISLAEERLGHLHIQDTDGRFDRHWAPGHGTINWRAVFEAVIANCEKSRPRLILETKDYMTGWKHLSSSGLAR